MLGAFQIAKVTLHATEKYVNCFRLGEASKGKILDSALAGSY